MINARSETAAAKPAFREALRFPAEGFYEQQAAFSARVDTVRTF
jgi:putative SOS response-associated peptidase YedK